MSKPQPLSAREARAIAITAQGLATARPAQVDAPALRALIQALGVIQIDSVNVLARSHYLPAWSRLGAYDHAALDALSRSAPRSVFEYWGHEASLLPIELQPQLRWRMARAREQAWGRIRKMARRKVLTARVLAVVAERGPIRAGELETTKPKRKGWWQWSEVKVAIEWLFWSGQVTSAGRRGFERLYDLPDRVLPAEVLAIATPDEADAQRALIERAGRALGVATEADLRDYYRIKPGPARPAIAALVETGVLIPTRVENWPALAYTHRDATSLPIDRERSALLSPFDSWCGSATHGAAVGMRYRIEIYVPQDKRVHGYYVLPFLLGDALVARVDLKADRAAGVLRVQAAHPEPAAPRGAATALARELRAMACWLGLARVEVEPRGALAKPLQLAVARTRK